MRRLLPLLLVLAAIFGSDIRFGTKARAQIGMGPAHLSRSYLLPAQLRNLQLWLRADIGSQAGGTSATTFWQDQGPLRLKFTNSVGPPVFNATDSHLNGLPSWSFSANSSMIAPAAWPSVSQPYTIYCVYYAASFASQINFVQNGSGLTELSAKSTQSFAYAGSFINNASAPSTSTSHVAVAVFNDPSSILYVDSSTAVASGSTGAAVLGAGTNMRIGQAGTSNIAEVIIDAAADSQSTVSAVISAMGSKYGQSWN